MKKVKVGVIALIVGASAVLMSSCIGSFGLTKKIHAWNKTVTNNRWTNEGIFAVLFLFQGYTISVLADVVVLNTIEFWKRKSPVAGIDMKVQGEKGEYHVKSNENGYRIEHLSSGEVANFVFDSATRTWSVESNGQSIQLVQFIDDNNAKAFFGEQELVFNIAKTEKLLAQQ